MPKGTPKNSENREDENTDVSCIVTRMSPCCHKAFAVVLEYCNVYFLALGVLAVLFIGTQWPKVGVSVSDIYIPHVCLALCFFLCGLRTKTDELLTAVKSYKAIIWGVLTILVVIPAAGTQITKTIQFATMTQNEDMNTSQSSVVGNVTAIGPTEFAIALQVFFIVPASMSAGAILSYLAGGSFALALLLMVVTNSAAVFTVPPMLPWMTDLNSTVNFTSFGKVMAWFSLTTVIPTVFGQLLRLVGVVAEKVDSKNRLIRYAIITLFVLSVWPEASRAQAEEEFYNIVSINILIIIGYSSIMHIMFLLVNWIAGGALSLDLPVKKTVVILGSHKALSYALTVLRFLSDDVGSKRLMSIVCTTAYLTLLFLDSVIVCKWAAITKKADGEEDEESENAQNEKYRRIPQDTD